MYMHVHILFVCVSVHPVVGGLCGNLNGVVPVG